MLYKRNWLWNCSVANSIFILVRGSSDGLTHETTTIPGDIGRYDDDGVFGLSGRSTIFCLVMGTEWDQGPMEINQLAQIATTFLNVINQA